MKFSIKYTHSWNEKLAVPQSSLHWTEFLKTLEPAKSYAWQKDKGEKSNTQSGEATPDRATDITSMQRLK